MPQPPKPVRVRGADYPSQAHAARALGVSLSAVRHAKRAGRLDGLGLVMAPVDPCPVQIRGVDYPSMGVAARALGVSRSAVWSALEKGTLDRVGLGRAEA